MLSIMRDPRCGALGVTALVCAILLKIAFIASIPLMYRG
jgi:cobalamin synthase